MRKKQQTQPEAIELRIEGDEIEFLKEALEREIGWSRWYEKACKVHSKTFYYKKRAEALLGILNAINNPTD